MKRRGRLNLGGLVGGVEELAVYEAIEDVSCTKKQKV